MTLKKNIFFYDTTLRDGSQTKGVDFSLTDKMVLCHQLDALGIDYIEVGWPGANPIDTEFFNNPPFLKHAKIVAFGMTPKNAQMIDDDVLFQTLIHCSAEILCIVGKTHDYHVELALGISLDDNLANLSAGFQTACQTGKEIFFDCEHFFDGYQSNKDYTLRCLDVARQAGVKTFILCDTNGGSLPETIFNITQEIVMQYPDCVIGIHCHNDSELAVANTLSALKAGARHLQGTINGLGERCGNTNLASVIPNILLKKPYSAEYLTSITHDNLKHLTSVSRCLDEILNRPQAYNLPYVGVNAFAHKGGLHVSAVLKDPTTYEHINPEIIGNKRIIPVSNQSGKSNIIMRLQEYNLDFTPTSEQIEMILDEIKKAETEGYGYDSAGASFFIKAMKVCGQLPEFFTVDSFRATSDGQTAEAIVKLIVNEQKIMNVAEGHGPVDALYKALIKDLGDYHNDIKDISLEDYKVRIIGQSTAAKTRVLIDFKDNHGKRWSSVGVSDDIVKASFEALLDSIIYRLWFCMKEPV